VKLVYFHLHLEGVRGIASAEKSFVYRAHSLADSIIRLIVEEMACEKRTKPHKHCSSVRRHLKNTASKCSPKNKVGKWFVGTSLGLPSPVLITISMMKAYECKLNSHVYTTSTTQHDHTHTTTTSLSSTSQSSG